MRYADKIPYVFILDYLTGVDLVIKPMFGCYGIYTSGRLCLFMQQREKPILPERHPGEQNGIYVATTSEHVEDLRETFPTADFQTLKDKKVWIYINETNEYFEQYTVRACEMISTGDPRIGR